MAKVKYGLSNVHYAVATIDDTTHAATYGTPVAFPGAVSMTLEAQGELTPMRADNIDYWVGNSNNGYQGDLEMALITDDFLENVLGQVKDTSGMLVELKDTEAIHFALLYQFEGDDAATKHVLYNCTASRPSQAGQTTEDTIEPQTETVTITASSIFNTALGQEVVKAKAKKTDSTYATFYEAVAQPTALESE